MNISVNKKNSASKWAIVAASSLLMASVVAGCGNKSATDNTSTTSTSGGTTSTSTTDLNGGDVVATVNGENITRGDMYPLMVASAGETTLNDIINYQLVMQELKKNNLSVSDTEIDQFLNDRKNQDPKQGAQIDQIIKDGGSRLAAIRRRAGLQLAVEKLVTKDVKADPAAVKAWFAKNQTRYATPSRVKIGLLIAGTKVRADTMLAQLKAKSKTFAQLVDDQKKTSDPAAQQSNAEIPELSSADLTKTLGSVLGPPAEKLAVGGFTPVLSLGKTAFGILTIVSKTPEVKPDFPKMQDRITGDYKLEQVARDQVSKNPGGQKFEQVLTQIESAVARQGQQQGNFSKPGYHDLLGILTQGKVQEIQTRLHNEAKVTVADADLKKVADQFKSASASPDSTTSNAATSNSATSNSPTSDSAPSKSEAFSAASPAKP